MELDWLDEVAEELESVQAGEPPGRGLLSVMSQAAREAEVGAGTGLGSADRELLDRVRGLREAYLESVP